MGLVGLVGLVLIGENGSLNRLFGVRTRNSDLRCLTV